MADDAIDISKVSVLGRESIHCGFHLAPYVARTVVSELPSSAYVFVSDTHVASVHLGRFQKEFARELDRQGRAGTTRVLSYLVAPGEESKSRAVKAKVEDWMFSEKCTRDTVIIALGGGVVGDLTGFLAATYMRGVPFVQIPTTLLAMVDSSVGGKTAIDVPAGKNLVGAFWQPRFVFIDASLLETLPQREVKNGMAEVIKTAAIWDAEEFATLESSAPSILAASSTPSSTPSSLHTGRTLASRTAAQSLLLRVIVASISVKAHVVTVDERETGLRNLVNFGHTIGHAIEAVLAPEVLHGECVAVGMVLEAEVARARGVLSQVGVGRLTRCLKAYGLPTSLSDPLFASLPKAKTGLGVERLLDIMKVDKKNAGAEKRIVLLSRIGATAEQRASAVSDAVIRRVLSTAVRVLPGTPHKEVTLATPGSKSISNRAMVLAALGKGTVRIKNLLHSDDTAVMMAALHDLKGAEFAFEDGGDTLVVKGGEGKLSPPSGGKEVYLQNAGTAARFLTTVCTLVQPSASATSTVITGNARMKQRPIGPLVDALRTNGSAITYVEAEGGLPLRITAAESGLAGGHIQLAASVSSQYVSSILLCAPYAAKEVRLELVGGQVISQPYIDMTIAMMRDFGVEVEREVDAQTGKKLDVYRIPRKTYTNPAEYNVESDASSATYPAAIAAITGTTVVIQNIGSSSLQGDAGFAKNVLEPMGCTVVQTASETRVTGPPVGTLRQLGDIDMETMTDAFLTASVLLAVATGKPAEGRKKREGNGTRIYGIANQRQKECERIQAMADELAKFGVRTEQDPDSITVFPVPLEQLKADVSVHCYDDHRVALAFSCLALVAKGVVLEEKRCVEKTFPNWWDDLENNLGIKSEGVELEAEAGPSTLLSSQVAPVPAPSPAGAYNRNASILVIGMRGSGKTTIGGFAARALGRTFTDADQFLEEQENITVFEYVQTHGWPAFRKLETDILRRLIEKYPTGHIISLGGGICETSAAREMLKAYAADPEGGPVVYIERDEDEVVHYLQYEKSRPAYGSGDEVRDVYRRRKPWLLECSSNRFVNYLGLQSRVNAQLSGHPSEPASEGTLARGELAEISRFFKLVAADDTNHVDLKSGARTYFLSLTYPDVFQALPLLDRLKAGVDALELRVDLLSPSGKPPAKPAVPSAEYVSLQLSALRQCTSLPIIFTVRSVSQGGMFPDDKVEDRVALLELAVALGCEYVDVELTLPEKRIAELHARRGNSKLITSWHDWTGKLKWDGEEIMEKYTTASKYGDVVKLVGAAQRIEDNYALVNFVESATSPSAPPIIALNTGTLGQLSRVVNRHLTPVTHPLLPSRAAPGQLSFAEIQQALHLVGQLPARQFYLFGTPISASPSPTIHNTGFQHLGFPHYYSLHETSTIDDTVKAVLNAPDFGGASVTIPHKLDIIPELDTLSLAAHAIGAVNTVVVRQGPDGQRELFGDNTDWQAIAKCAEDNLAAEDPITSKSTGLVIGAGGTSRAALYALHNLGVGTIYLYNRTRANAEKLAAVFPDFHIVVLDSLDEYPAGPPMIVVSTVPGSGTTTDETAQVGGSGRAGVYLPPNILARKEGGVVIDMSYRPYITPLLGLAQEKKCWKTVAGITLLLEQGFRQFTLWTGRTPPKKEVEKAAWAKYRATAPPS